MRMLLDTHVLIWYLEGNESLSRRHRDLIVNADNEVFVSISSLWEVAIKTSIGKLTIAKPLTDIFKQLSVQSINILGIQPGHVLQVAALPFHHRDPFDRMIIAQSYVEFLPIITHDKTFADYGVKLL
ncbi:MAG: type II toxin-antitoxin system VapC family toxin [Acidobacteria bacterium]|nr:type II toxin-antitoxin system VapC family toxin [Acidobacteriota bacterium]